MNRVLVIVCNPAYVADVELDEDEDEEMEDVPQILRAVVSSLEELNQEFRSILSPTLEDTGSHQSPVVTLIEVWDTGRTWERGHRLHPESSRKEISDGLSNQVLDLLRIMHERINQQT